MTRSGWSGTIPPCWLGRPQKRPFTFKARGPFTDKWERRFSAQCGPGNVTGRLMFRPATAISKVLVWVAMLSTPLQGLCPHRCCCAGEKQNGKHHCQSVSAAPCCCCSAEVSIGQAADSDDSCCHSAPIRVADNGCQCNCGCHVRDHREPAQPTNKRNSQTRTQNCDQVVESVPCTTVRISDDRQQRLHDHFSADDTAAERCITLCRFRL